jgi:sugar/nucleoside kinase (ribokinase family)
VTIVVLGDVLVDVIARLPGPLRRGTDTPAPVELVGGGSAANTASWIRAAGSSVRLVGTVGADVLGGWVTDELARRGIELSLRVDPDRPTGTCVVLVDPDGERTMIPSPGASSALAPAADRLDGASAVHLSGYALFAEEARGVALEWCSRARASGLPVSLDAASSGPLERFGPTRFLDAAAGILLFANREEAELLAGTPGLPAAELARRVCGPCAEVMVKDGAAGAAWSDGSDVVAVPAPPVPGPLDTTGAGDAFAAGVLTARSSGGAIAEQLRRGAELAALAVQQTGGRPPGQARR